MENAHIKLKQFDLFAGYGGFTIAGERCGFETIGFSEIDKYANAVLKYHYPNITNYYDITKIDWAEVPDFDLLTGGSPCQDLSIAGKRAGLAGARSGLFYEYMRAVKEKRPRYFIWENVKGALSSNQGWDFAYVINEMAEAGYSLWWQICNAKDYGVPQNRERIFVVGFRDGSPREVFFERANSEQNLRQVVGGSQGYRVYDADGIACNQASQAGGVGAKTGLYISRVCRKEGIYDLRETEVSGSLTASMFKGIDASGRTGVLERNIPITRGRSTEPWKESEVAPSRRLSDKDDIKIIVKEATKQGYAIAEEGDSINLSVPNSKTRRGRVGKGIAQTQDTGMQQYTLVDTNKKREYNGSINNNANHYDSTKGRRPEEEMSSVRSTINSQEIQRTIGGLENLSEEDVLRLGMPQGDNAEQMEEERTTKSRQLQGDSIIPENRNLREMQGEEKNRDSSQKRKQTGQSEKEFNGDMSRLSHNGASDGSAKELLEKKETKSAGSFRIRRLTVKECERLMSLPDNWTSKGAMNNKEVEISDSQRYKMCGNGVVVNVVEELINQLIIC